MKQKIKLIVTFLLFSTIVNAEPEVKPSVAPSQGTVQAIAPTAAKVSKPDPNKLKVKCPEGIGAKEGDEPKLVASAENGFYFVVCGFYDPELTHKIGKKMMSEFEVYYTKKDGKLSEPVVKYGALDNVAIRTRAGRLYLEKYIYVPTGYYLETFRSQVVCSKEDCELQDEKCKFEKKPRPPFVKSSLKELESYVSGENKEKPITEALLKRLIESAMSGDEKAIDVFIGERKFQIDGDVGEHYNEFSDVFKKLKDGKCL